MQGPSECVYARNCSIRRLDKERAADFLTRNHYLGACKARYHYGLFTLRTTGHAEKAVDEGTLVAVGSFSNARRFQDGHTSYEWIRYASLKGLRVMGGMSKILKTFRDEHHPGDVMTYVDASLTDGKAYKDMGFKEVQRIERADYTNLKLKLFLPQEGE